MDLRVNLGDGKDQYWLWIEVKWGDAEFHRSKREAQLQRLRNVALGARDEEWRLVLPGQKVGQAKRNLEKAQDLGYLIVYPGGEGFSWELYLAYRDTPHSVPEEPKYRGSVKLPQRERDALKQPRQPRAAATAGTPSPSAPLQMLELQQLQEQMKAEKADQGVSAWQQAQEQLKGDQGVGAWLHRCRGEFRDIPLTHYSVPDKSAYKAIDAPEPLQRSLSLYYCMAKFLEMEGISTEEGISHSALTSLRDDVLARVSSKGRAGGEAGMAYSPGGIESRRALALAVAFPASAFGLRTFGGSRP